MSSLEDLSDARLLLVDDTKANLDVLVEGLRGEFKLSVALDGEAALRSLTARPPDLALLDIMMPGMDGYEVCRRIRAGEAGRDIPVIFVTALDEEINETLGFEVGAVDYVRKPVSIPIVRARVRTHLWLSRARRVLADQNLQLIEAGKLREDVERISRHDLKQPLNAIIGIPRLVQALGGLTEKQSAMLERIVASGYRMLNMINLSLDLYKMETGSYRPRPVAFDMAGVIRKVFEESASYARSCQLELLFEAPGAPAGVEASFPVFGEELLSYTMLSNLVKNAMEASPRGGRVRVSAAEDVESARVSIHNQGAIPEAVRGRFFEKYTTSGKLGGTGLGAYSALLMARTQGGEISVETSEANGTCITVRLPRAPEAPPADRGPLPEAGDATVRASCGAGAIRDLQRPGP